jgi:hypothetical protein
MVLAVAVGCLLCQLFVCFPGWVQHFCRCCDDVTMDSLASLPAAASCSSACTLLVLHTL